MDDLKAKLRSSAESTSRIQRQIAEAKSLRQEGNTERRTDLYAWPKPDQTLEGKALAHIEALEADNAWIARIAVLGAALVVAIDQMVEDTKPMFAEMELVRGRGPYQGKQIGVELEAFRTALAEIYPERHGHGPE